MIKKIAAENDEYFSGRNIGFAAGFRYDQCLVSPYEANAYFTVQNIQGRDLETSDRLKARRESTDTKFKYFRIEPNQDAL